MSAFTFARDLVALLGFLESAQNADGRFNHGPGWPAANASYLHLLECLVTLDDGATGEQIAAMVAEAAEVYRDHLDRIKVPGVHGAPS